MKESILYGAIVVALIPLLYYNASDARMEEIVLDTTIYDPRFNWYNTNGSLPIIDNKSVVFASSDRTNVYQDAVSILTLHVNRYIELSAKVEYNIEDYSDTDKDEFAIFTTSDINNYDQDEFGFTTSERNGILYAYIQSQKIDGFFIWQPLFKVENGRVYQLSAIYSNGMVRFYVDNNLVWERSFVDLSNKDMHLVLTSHKLSNADLSNNHMRIYKAYIKG